MTLAFHPPQSLNKISAEHGCTGEGEMALWDTHHVRISIVFSIVLCRTSQLESRGTRLLQEFELSKDLWSWCPSTVELFWTVCCL